MVRLEIGDARAEVEATLREWAGRGGVRRLWQGDASLWTGSGEERWLGWLNAVESQREQIGALRALVEEVTDAGYRHAVLLGMGGSSLCPDVLRRTFRTRPGHPELLVLDSVVPAQVRAVAERIDPSRTLFIVSSKSGTTVEVRVLQQLFHERVREAVGERAGENFVAVTDPGTPLDDLQKRQGFRFVAYGVPSIGGRYSALSSFGMLPASVMGLDVPDFLSRTEPMVRACRPGSPPEENPGLVLGAALGGLARRGRDKLTLVTSPEIAHLGSWVEQLVAESTGKQGRGIVPVEGEPLGEPGVYGRDRVFVYERLESAPDRGQDAAVEALGRAGHPVIRLSIESPMDLGAAFFRWEIATAVAGSILGINPFDQPDVEAAKKERSRLIREYEERGAIPSPEPIAEAGSLRFFAEPHDAEALDASAGAEHLLRDHLHRIEPGDYFAITAFLEMSRANIEPMHAIRRAVRDARRVATTVGLGPRFLHSTEQLHMGGPNRGVFLNLTADDPEDLEIPGERYTFGVLKQLQSCGDRLYLARRGRRALRVHLGSDPARGLEELHELVRAAFRYGAG